MFAAKMLVWAALGVAIAVGSSYLAQSDLERNVATQIKGQLDDTDASAREARLEHWSRNQTYAGALIGWLGLGVLMFALDAKRLWKKAVSTLALLALVTLSGCLECCSD